MCLAWSSLYMGIVPDVWMLAHSTLAMSRRNWRPPSSLPPFFSFFSFIYLYCFFRSFFVLLFVHFFFLLLLFTFFRAFTQVFFCLSFKFNFFSFLISIKLCFFLVFVSSFCFSLTFLLILFNLTSFFFFYSFRYIFWVGFGVGVGGRYPLLVFFLSFCYITVYHNSGDYWGKTQYDT